MEAKYGLDTSTTRRVTPLESLLEDVREQEASY